MSSRVGRSPSLSPIIQEKPATTAKTTAVQADQRQLQHLRWMVLDALNHASGLAARAQEATVLFDKVRQAIADFRTENPTMQALASAAVRHLK